MPVRLTGVRFAYDKAPVIDDLSLELAAGELTVLLGPNGAGKTTLIELILGTLRPQAGSVQVFGHDPAQAEDAPLARLGVVPQSCSDRPKWRISDLLEWVRAHFVAAGRQALSVQQAAAAVGLEDVMGKRLGELSGGQRRRADVAAGLIGLPDFAVLDEPTAGLDAQSRVAVHDLVEAQVDRGAAVLLSTHDMAEAQRVADRVLVLNAGRIIFDGTAPQLRERVGDFAQITWIENGARHVHSTNDAEGFMRTLDLARISNLEVTRPNLEDAYLDLLEKANGQVNND